MQVEHLESLTSSLVFRDQGEEFHQRCLAVSIILANSCHMLTYLSSVLKVDLQIQGQYGNSAATRI